METEQQKPKRIRRTKAQMAAARAAAGETTPAGKLAVAQRSIKRKLKEIARDLWVNEWIVNAGLVASGLQLLVAFTYGTGSWFEVMFSALAATFKATFIEACIYALNKTIAWAGVVRMNWKRTAVLWATLAVVMFISTKANLLYERHKMLNAKNVELCMYSPKACAPTPENIDKYLTTSENFDAWLRGGLIPALVLAMIAARRLLGTAAETFERDEMHRIKDRVRGVEYRARKRRFENEIGGEG